MILEAIFNGEIYPGMMESISTKSRRPICEDRSVSYCRIRICSV